MAFDFPSSPTVGQQYTPVAGTMYVYNGYGWTSGGNSLSVSLRVFPASTSYVPTAGMQFAIVEAIGGGGAGGGCQPNAVNTGSGGGSGGYSRRILTAAAVGASQSITVGAGGTSPGYTVGNSGGDTAFGNLVLAKGGLGGRPSSSEVGPPGGDGAPATGTGDIVCGGTPGQPGFYSVASAYSTPGAGAGGPFGGGGAVAFNPSTTGNQSQAGLPGKGYGSGGAGGAGNGVGTVAGGAGSAGVVIVTEYILTGNVSIAAIGGNSVNNSGTPTVDQLAQWVDATHIKGIDATSLGWSTGDVKQTLKTVADPGWVMMADGTIGNAGSGATYANANALALFTLLWGIASLQLYNTVGGAIGRGASVTSDWNNLYVMGLPKSLGRAMAGAGAGLGLTNFVLGASDGAETHSPTAAEMVAHQHGPGGPGQSLNTDGNTGLANQGGPYYLTTAWPGWSATASAGSSSPFNVLNPRTYINYMIKL